MVKKTINNIRNPSERWIFSPLVFLASSGLIAMLVTKSGSIDYPYLLIGGITSVMYIWPKWKEWPDSFHNTFMLTCIITTVVLSIVVLGYYIYSLLRKEEIYE